MSDDWSRRMQERWGQRNTEALTAAMSERLPPPPASLEQAVARRRARELSGLPDAQVAIACPKCGAQDLSYGLERECICGGLMRTRKPGA